MADDQPNVADYLGEVERDCQKLLEQAQEAARHYAEGKPASAALVLGLMHYPLGQTADAISWTLAELRDQENVTPDDALKQDPSG